MAVGETVEAPPPEVRRDRSPQVVGGGLTRRRAGCDMITQPLASGQLFPREGLWTTEGSTIHGGGLISADRAARGAVAGLFMTMTLRKERMSPGTERLNGTTTGSCRSTAVVPPLSFHRWDIERPSGRNGFVCRDKGEVVPGTARDGLVALPAREVAAGSAVDSGGGLVGVALPWVRRTRGLGGEASRGAILINYYTLLS